MLPHTPSVPYAAPAAGPGAPVLWAGLIFADNPDPKRVADKDLSVRNSESFGDATTLDGQRTVRHRVTNRFLVYDPNTGTVSPQFHGLWYAGGVRNDYLDIEIPVGEVGDFICDWGFAYGVGNGTSLYYGAVHVFDGINGVGVEAAPARTFIGTLSPGDLYDGFDNVVMTEAQWFARDVTVRGVPVTVTDRGANTGIRMALNTADAAGSDSHMIASYNRIFRIE